MKEGESPVITMDLSPGGTSPRVDDNPNQFFCHLWCHLLREVPANWRQHLDKLEVFSFLVKTKTIIPSLQTTANSVPQPCSRQGYYFQGTLGRYKILKCYGEVVHKRLGGKCGSWKLYTCSHCVLSGYQLWCRCWDSLRRCCLTHPSEQRLPENQGAQWEASTLLKPTASDLVYVSFVTKRSSLGDHWCLY